MSPMNSNAQESTSFFSGFGFEIGGGYNQLFWSATNADGSTTSFNRTAFSFMPSARIHYQFSIFKKTTLYTFTGYNEFGGHSKLEQSTVILIEDVRYQDQLKFRNLEAGLIGLYNISDLRFGIGAKGNYRIGLEHRYYYENHPQRLDGWRSDDVSYYFNNLSVDVGIRLEYPIFRNILLASEGWFGITDLSKEEHNMFVRENHFRLMVGYRF